MIALKSKFKKVGRLSNLQAGARLAKPGRGAAGYLLTYDGRQWPGSHSQSGFDREWRQQCGREGQRYTDLWHWRGSACAPRGDGLRNTGRSAISKAGCVASYSHYWRSAGPDPICRRSAHFGLGCDPGQCGGSNQHRIRQPNCCLDYRQQQQRYAKHHGGGEIRAAARSAGKTLRSIGGAGIAHCSTCGRII